MLIKQLLTPPFQHLSLVYSRLICLVGLLMITACAPAPTEAPTQVQPSPTSTSQPPTLTPLPPTVTSSPSPTPTRHPLASTLEGIYTVTFTKDELAQTGVTEHELCENAGTHEITFEAEGWTWKQTPPEDCGNIKAPTGRGTWQLSDDQITLNEPAAFGCGQTSTYNWKLEEDSLVFTVVEDACRYRVILLTTHPWAKIK